MDKIEGRKFINKLDPKLKELLDKEYNTETEVEWMKDHSQVKDIQNVGCINIDHPEHEQLNIIVKNIFDSTNDEVYHNYLLKDTVEIKAFKCLDGAIFEDEEEAKKHTINYHLKRKLEKFCTAHCCYNMDEDDVLKVLLNNLEELKGIFGGE